MDLPTVLRSEFERCLANPFCYGVFTLWQVASGGGARTLLPIGSSRRE